MSMATKERPILFSAPMVRALLDGTKTQTRRVVKPWQCPGQATGSDEWIAVAQKHPRWGFVVTGTSEAACADNLAASGCCPYGKPGDRLWVRETWQGPLFGDMDAYRAEPDDFNKPEFCEYAADGGPAPEFMTMDDDLVCRWRPSIHMPRWASRILLEIVSVRVERLNAISEADAQAEGCPCYVCSRPMDGKAEDDCHCFHRKAGVSDYRHLWESINGPGSWDKNPWVWVVEFRRATTTDTEKN